MVDYTRQDTGYNIGRLVAVWVFANNKDELVNTSTRTKALYNVLDKGLELDKLTEEAARNGCEDLVGKIGNGKFNYKPATLAAIQFGYYHQLNDLNRR